MSQKTRIIAILGIIIVIAVALGVQGWLQGRSSAISAEPEPGRIHVYVDDRFAANVEPSEIGAIPTASFVDAEKGKTQEGPRVKDVILLYVDEGKFQDDSTIIVKGVQASEGEAKEATLTWSQVASIDNNVLFDFSASGDSIKLVSTLPGLDTRDAWVQGVQRIDVKTRP